MKKSIKGVRVFREHSKDCHAIQSNNWPDNPLWMPGAQRRADSIGRPVSHRILAHTWEVFQCNSTDCHAEVWVRRDVLTRYAHQLMSGAIDAARRGKK